MKLTYWSIECTDDADCYSIVAPTKKEAIALYRARSDGGVGYASEVCKVEFHYKSAFDLFDYVTGEGGTRCGSPYVIKVYPINSLNRENT